MLALFVCTSLRSTFATIAGQPVKRTSHAKPPAAGASDRGSARLFGSAPGRTTRSLLSCLVPRLNVPQSSRPGEAARTDVNHKRKGKP